MDWITDRQIVDWILPRVVWLGTVAGFVIGVLRKVASRTKTSLDDDIVQTIDETAKKVLEVRK